MGTKEHPNNTIRRLGGLLGMDRGATLSLAVVALVAAGGMMLLVHSHNRDEAIKAEQTRQRVKNASATLADALVSLMVNDDLSGARRLVVATAQRYQLLECRVVMANGRTVASNEPSKIDVDALPEAWPDKWPNEAASNDPDTVACMERIVVPGKGELRLYVAAPTLTENMSLAESKSTELMILAGVLAGLMLILGFVRVHDRTLNVLRSTVLSLREGEACLDALRMSPKFGVLAEGWNKLVDKAEHTQREVIDGQLQQGVGERRRSDRGLEGVCDVMWQGLIVVDGELKVTYANGAAAMFLRTDSDGMPGRAAADLIEDEKVIEGIRGIAEGRTKQRISYEIEREGGDGTEVLRFSARPVRREDSGAAIIVIEDITQQHVAEVARNDFLAHATHELRTPLTNILLNAELVQTDGDEDASLRAQCMNVINQEARRLDRMVNDILSVSEIEAGSLRLDVDDVPLATMLDELKADYAASAKEKELTLQFDLPPKLPVIQGDRDKVIMAMQNLLGNAIKYTPKGGTVIVSIEATADMVSFTVQDTGIGISEEDQAKVFDKFYRASDKRITGITGSGLGLALAREVVRMHGGDITVESQVDEGSRFTMTLPLSTTALAA